MHFYIICKSLSLVAEGRVANFYSRFYQGQIKSPRTAKIIAALAR
jgi:hypothetical protein